MSRNNMFRDIFYCFNSAKSMTKNHYSSVLQFENSLVQQTDFFQSNGFHSVIKRLRGKQVM